MTGARPTQGWIAEFDGLRGIAVTLVLGHHLWADGGLPEVWPFTVPFEVGWIGVDLFFVLSGFLITGILVRTKGEPRYWSRFAIRRALRIFPLYALFLGLVALWIVPMIRAGEEVVPWWTYLLLVQNWWMGLGVNRPGNADPTWSLAIEEQFYLLWPLLVWVCSIRGLQVVLVTVICAAPALRLVIGDALTSDAVYYWTICRIDALAIGALLCVVWEREPVRRWILRVAGPLVVLVCAAAFGGLFERAWPPFMALGYTAVALAAGGLLVGIRADRWPVLGRALRWPPLAALGQISYGVYLWHRFALGAVAAVLGATLGRPETGLLPAVLYVALGPACGVFLAWVSWRYWEAPWLSLKDRLAPPPG